MSQIILPAHTIWTMIMAPISVLCGGFIATYFAKEKKMLYGIYAGVGIMSINIFFALVYQFGTFTGIIIVFFMTILFTGIGGFIGEKIDGKY